MDSPPRKSTNSNDRRDAARYRQPASDGGHPPEVRLTVDLTLRSRLTTAEVNLRARQEEQREDHQTPLRNGRDDIVEAIILVLVANLRRVARRSARNATGPRIAGFRAVAEQSVIADRREAGPAPRYRSAEFFTVPE